MNGGAKVGVLTVQPASSSLLHCFAGGGVHFNSHDPARVSQVSGVHSAYLVTANRSPEDRCLVVTPELSVEQGNADALYALMQAIGRVIGLESVHLVRPIERHEGGSATDRFDWLKW